jgi:hypothetical protein
VTVNAGSQTIVTFIDAAIPIVPTNGFLQVCKVAGTGITVGTNFAFNVGGTPVTVPAGLAPGGTCATPVTVPAGAAVITETVPAGTALTSVSTLPSAGLLVSSNLGAGTATVTVNAGSQTIVTFIDAAIPVVPTNGFLQVSKVAGAGITVGTNFTFNVAGTPVIVAAGPAPGGTCGAPVTVPAGVAVITETVPAGTALTGVSTLPGAGLLVSSNLGAGIATVTVLAGGQTIVTFIDAAAPAPPNGFVQVCKVAGAGITVGTNFTFNVAGTPVTVAAGPAPGGTCATPVTVPAGAAAITETVPAGSLLAGVSTLPNAGLLVSSNLGAGTATVTVNAGSQTIVTFIDAAIPIVPTNGFLQVCKVAGTGITVGTNFAFNVGGTPVTVPAGLAPGGTCATPVTVPAGAAVITETVPAGTALTGVSTLPSTGLLVSSNLGAGTATVTVLAGGQTIITFIDAVPTTGLVQVCKVAGAGVTVGTNFAFHFAGTTVTVPAGATPGASCSPALVAPVGPVEIAETPISNPQAAFQIGYAANLDVGDSFVNLTNDGTLDGADPAGRICVNVYTFDSSEAMVSCCACLVTPNGLNSLSVRNDLISNSLTPAVPTSVVIDLLASTPAGGTCNATTPIAANLVGGMHAWGTTLHALTTTSPVTYRTAETPFLRATLSSTGLTTVSTLPSAALLVGSNLSLGTATVTVTPGGRTIATFTNASAESQLARLTTLCAFSQWNGSGYGICKSCRVGGLGANRW